MTLMVMSINSPNSRSPMAGFKMTVLCWARLASPLTSCHVGSRLSSLSPFLFFSVLTASCHSALENHSQVTASVTLPLSITLVLTLLSFPLHSSPSNFLSVLCLPAHQSALLHLHPSILKLSHTPSLFSFALLPYGVIALSQASIFMTIIEGRMLMPLDFSLPVSQQQQEEGR